GYEVFRHELLHGHAALRAFERERPQEMPAHPLHLAGEFREGQGEATIGLFRAAEPDEGRPLLAFAPNEAEARAAARRLLEA
ncbi:MAG: hypothetical protein ACK5TM_10500, partial [Methylobacterium sp.]